LLISTLRNFVSRRGRRIGLVGLTLLLTVCLLPADLLGRAGGGQRWSGGGRGGGGGWSGGSGGDDGGGFIIYLLFRLIIEAPVIGVPLLIAVIAFIIYSAYKGKQVHESSIIRRGVAAEERVHRPEYIAAIRANDPAFDANLLLDRVRRAFVRIQYAWSRQDLSDVRAFISDAVHERFSLQFDEQRAMGYRNDMRDVVVRHAGIAHARSGHVFDEVSIRIEASASDQDVDLRTGRPIPGTRAAGEFVEVWSFLRRRGATTDPDKPGLMEGQCPNCGGPIEMNQSAKCGYCGALLRSGQYDWVLAEITQQYEWEPRKKQDIPGVAILRRRDPEFNAQELEDRASVIFWRRAAADRLNSVTPLLKVALPAFAGQYAQEATQHADQPRMYYGECAVGSVDLLGIIPARRDGGAPNGTPPQGVADGDHDGGETAGPQDLALVKVRWQGHRFVVMPNGTSKRGDKSAVANSLFVLARSADARTNPDLSVSSAHCPSCGAPEVGGSGAQCGHCGTPLNRGDQQWALQEITDIHTRRAQELLDRLPEGRSMSDAYQPAAANGNGGLETLTGSSAASTLRWMVKMTYADGGISPKEWEVLQRAALRYGVPEHQLEEYLLAAESGSLDVTEPASDEETRRQLSDMARTALADGHISGGESALLKTAGRRLGLGDNDIRYLLRRTRSDMLQEAREVLRAVKKR